MARHSAAEWQVLVSGWRASRMSGRAFAAAHGIDAQTLSWWAWRLGSRGRPRPVTSPAFAEVVVADAADRPGADFVLEIGVIRVRVPSGFDGGELRRLVAALC